MSLREMLSDYWYAFQQELFPRLEGELGGRAVGGLAGCSGGGINDIGADEGNAGAVPAGDSLPGGEPSGDCADGARDATAIEAREKAAPKPKAAKPKRRKRGRPRKGEARAKEPSRLERQLTMSLPQMLADLPRACDVGSKRNAKGHTTSCRASPTGHHARNDSLFLDRHGLGRPPEGEDLAGLIERLGFVQIEG